MTNAKLLETLQGMMGLIFHPGPWADDECMAVVIVAISADGHLEIGTVAPDAHRGSRVAMSIAHDALVQSLLGESDLIKCQLISPEPTRES